MNFLAHLWLAERLNVELAGAILGDVVRGRLEERFPAALERSVRLHRRIDVLTDRHPIVVHARTGFPPGARRYAGILLDLMYDHVLARHWSAYSAEPLARFARRSAAAVAAAGPWFVAAGAPSPSAAEFARLLASYRHEAGLERALSRIERRLSRPAEWRAAAAGWRKHLGACTEELPALLGDLCETLRKEDVLSRPGVPAPGVR